MADAAGITGIDRLNSSLHPRVRFEIDAGSLSREAAGPVTATGTLVLRVPGGGGRSTSFPLVLSATRRQMFHSLAASFAECAMALGLGSGVYGGRSR